MKSAIKGGTGLVGGRLARALLDLDHEEKLAEAFAGCGAVAHCAGINREIGRQPYQRMHIEATCNVVSAAERAGVKKVALLSLLRARPDCGPAYHESKFAAEEIVRASGIDYPILKAGTIYGKGDHMLDHLIYAFHTFPVFGLVGLVDKPIRPTAVEESRKSYGRL